MASADGLCLLHLLQWSMPEAILADAALRSIAPPAWLLYHARPFEPFATLLAVTQSTRPSVLFLREPHWVSATRATLCRASPAIRSWIAESGSLTARLRHLCGSGFGVKLLRQTWGRPYAGEARLVGGKRDRNALLREVMLHCEGWPLIMARSVIPHEALRGTQCRLAHLGDRPLGELLFSYPRLARLTLEVAPISMEFWQPEVRRALDLDAVIFGRRSLYRVAKGHILVCEFFLPALESQVVR